MMGTPELYVQHIDAIEGDPQQAQLQQAQPQQAQPQQAEDAPVLVMLHGFMGSGQDLLEPARAVARTSGLRVVLPDLPGHGASAHVAPISLVHTAALVWGALRETTTVLLAGYSLGGRVALAMASAAPQRVRGLFLESAHPGLTSQDDRRARGRHDMEMALRLDGARTSAEFQAFLNDWYRQSVFLQEGRPPADIAARVSERVAARPDPEANKSPLAAALRACSLATQPDFWSVSAGFGPRAWYISGAADSRYVDVGRELARHHAELHHETVRGAGHTVHRDRPDAYLQALQTFVTTCIS